MNQQRSSVWGLSVFVGLLFLICLVTQAHPQSQDPRQRFLSGNPLHNIPLNQIVHGGPPVDGIPALVDPSMVPVSRMNRLSPKDRLMVVTIQGETRAYPRKILDHHELVNDRIHSIPILISWCPLCGSGMVFQRTINGETYEFGVSGLLYESDVLMYDRTTDSLWSQLRGEAVVGPMTGTELGRIPHTMTTWERFRKSHPGGRVLSFKTGYSRNYQATAYKRYRQTSGLMFPVSNRDSRLTPKTPVVGVKTEKISVAVTESKVYSKNLVVYEDGGARVLFLHWKDGVRVYRVPAEVMFAFKGGVLMGNGQKWTVTNGFLKNPEGQNYERIPHVDSYWFAWATFHPQTDLIQ